MKFKVALILAATILLLTHCGLKPESDMNLSTTLAQLSWQSPERWFC